MLRNELDTLLKPVNGKVLEVVVIPDFKKLFELENEKKDLEDLHTMIESQEQGLLTRAMMKLFYRSKSNMSIVEHRQDILNAQIDRQIERPFLSSGHAFVVVDSISSLNYCLKKTRMTPDYALKVAKASFKDELKQLTKNNLKKDPSQTFAKFEDEDAQIA